MSSSNNTKRKQADDSEGALNERKKKRSKPPENGVQDVNNTERCNKAKKEKHSYEDRKNPVKKPKMAKKVHEKSKPNLPTHTVTTSNNVSSLAQVERKSSKALALTSTNRPSREKSNMADKSNSPSQVNSGKGKGNLEPMKTNSKKSKTNANSKGKDLFSGKKTLNGIVTGNRAAVDSDTSSSQSSTESSSSSSTESSSAASNNVSSLAQMGIKSTKALALTSTVNTKLSKLSRPSKEKSNMKDKANNPSQRFSSKANIGKRKSNLEPLKTNSKKSKTNANSKGKDLVTGNRAAIDSDNSSSQSSTDSSSSSSTESSSESTDESGPSNSHSKVNGTVSQVASAELINNVKAPLHERLGKDVEHTVAKDSSVRKTGKDETRVPLQLHTNSKGNGALMESSSSSESSTDIGKSADAEIKDTRSASSSSESESEEEKAKLDNNNNNNNKETSSSLHPLLSSPSSQSFQSFPSPSLLRGIQIQDTNETSVNQPPIHSITEKISLFGQKQAQQSTIRGQNKKPGKAVC